jgi:transposase-like protein
MTRKKDTANQIDWKAVMTEDPDFLKSLVQKVVQKVLDAEMVEIVGAARGERTEARTGYRSGYYSRGLVTRVGRIEFLRTSATSEGWRVQWEAVPPG